MQSDKRIDGAFHGIRLVNYVHRYDGENLVQEPDSCFGPEIPEALASLAESAIGYEPNEKIRDAIEQFAVDRSTEHNLPENVDQTIALTWVVLGIGPVNIVPNVHPKPLGYM